MGPLDRVAATAANHTVIAFQPLLPAYSARVLDALGSGATGVELVEKLGDAQDPMGINEARRGQIIAAGILPTTEPTPDLALQRMKDSWEKYKAQAPTGVRHPNFSYLLEPNE